MTIFEKREQAAEGKFALDAELQFKIRAKRNKLIGLWAAEKIGLTGEKAKEYAFSVIDEDAKHVGDKEVLLKVTTDFTNAKIDVSEAQIKAQLLTFEAEAKKQLLGN